MLKASALALREAEVNVAKSDAELLEVREEAYLSQEFMDTDRAEVRSGSVVTSAMVADVAIAMRGVVRCFIAKQLCAVLRVGAGVRSANWHGRTMDASPVRFTNSNGFGRVAPARVAHG